MEKGTSWDLSLLIEELTQGEEQAGQLEARLDEPSSTELCKSLAQQIRLRINKAISMAKSINSEGSQQPPCPNNTSSGSPRSASGSPRSENSERAFKEHERREMSKKRKTLAKWTSQVRATVGANAEGPLDDGFSWRKYGQKDILGAKHPRGYYRCTYRKTQGCLATKQVQRSDEDPSIFDITYRGTHTCLHRPRVHSAYSASAPQAPDMQQNQQNPPADHDQQHPQHDQQLLESFRTSLKVKTEGLEMEDQVPTSSSFSFPSTPASNFKSENQIFSSPPTLENNYMSSFFPNFFSPTSSESNYFSVPCQMSCEGRPALHASESDLTDMISAATSVTNSPMVDLDFMLEPQMDIEPNFPFDNSNFFQ
ncbi:probable WRKY transcription factor 41 isoform X2 [Elaeis guineensis]|uniref:Probable WRKY transcription factor 41 isoform X2 n=1 Tax=Elaeis guineensis var. tenera TaxID=51953 RepID=A0A6I9QZQ8_ELAGV|nr:probable WRKY transcription factor 41 isoform X2 [Elaeis guineensis]